MRICDPPVMRSTVREADWAIVGRAAGRLSEPSEGSRCFEAVVRSFAPLEPLPLRWTFPVWIPANELDASAVRGRMTRPRDSGSPARIRTARRSC